MRYEIDTEKFYEFLLEECRQCHELEESFAEEGDWLKAFEYREDADVYGFLVDCLESGEKHDWLREPEKGRLIWHDLKKDSEDLPSESRLMLVVIEVPSGYSQIVWGTRNLPAGTVLWSYIPKWEEKHDRP